MPFDTARKLLRRCRDALYAAEGLLFLVLRKFYPAVQDFRSDMRFFSDRLREDSFQSLYRGAFARKCIEEADLICSHCFDLLGSGPVNLGRKIRWSTDCKSGFTWPRGFFKRIKIVDFSNRADVKVPWELSRFNHLIALGKAYRITHNPKYSAEFTEQVTDWIEGNPPGFSVNWSCVMEAAIRSVNWIAGTFLFRDESFPDFRFEKALNGSLLEHGFFIEKYLRYGCKNKNNHYIAHLAGLIWLGLYFRNSKGRIKSAAERWLKKGLEGFESQMSSQVTEDGSHKEMSTYYHKYVAEMFLLTAMICRENRLELPDGFNQRLLKMSAIVNDLVKPDGLSAFIGDEDDGRFLLFSSYFERCSRDFRAVLAAAGGYFCREDFLKTASPLAEDVYWMSGGEIKPPPGSLTLPWVTAKPMRGLGLYLMQNHSFYLLIRCGRFADRRLGGHMHNDQLSFVLNAGGLDFLVDPGTNVYTADFEIRNLFRSTGVHNTLFITGCEQNEIPPDKPFEMRERSFADCLAFSPEGFSGEHFGFLTDIGLKHKRRIDFSERGIVITDLLSGKAKKPFRAGINFTLDPRVSVEEDSAGCILRNGGIALRMRVSPGFRISRREGAVSFSYGTSCETSRIVIENIPADRPVKTEFILLQAGECVCAM